MTWGANGLWVAIGPFASLERKRSPEFFGQWLRNRI